MGIVTVEIIFFLRPLSTELINLFETPPPTILITFSSFRLSPMGQGHGKSLLSDTSFVKQMKVHRVIGL